MNPPVTYLGLDLSPHPALARRTYPNTPAGHRALLAALRQLPGPVQVLCEATGGYEHHLLAAHPAAARRPA